MRLSISAKGGFLLLILVCLRIVFEHNLFFLLRWMLTTSRIIIANVFCSLGATPMMELMIAAGKAVAQLQIEHGLAVERVYTGSFMTSLDMAGNWVVTVASLFSILELGYGAVIWKMEDFHC